MGADKTPTGSVNLYLMTKLVYVDYPSPKVETRPDGTTQVEDRGISFYLALEEYVARSMPADDYFFMWQVSPSVIFGRNQVPANEVNLDYCRAHGIRTYRRKSGGGCVYADQSNVMLSYITPENNVSLTFARYLSMVSETLQSIGLDARPSGHNDIMLGDRKVSGNAIYHIPGRVIAHGTLLYDTDMENMLHAITPSTTKLSKHGVESVRQRICLLKDYTSLSLEEVKRRIRNHLCGERAVLATAADLRVVREIEKEYLDPKFIGI